MRTNNLGNRTNHLKNEEGKELENLCKAFHDIFYDESDKLTLIHQVRHEIITDEISTQTRSYRYPFVHKERVQKKLISKMLEDGIIKRS